MVKNDAVAADNTDAVGDEDGENNVVVADDGPAYHPWFDATIESWKYGDYDGEYGETMTKRWRNDDEPIETMMKR